MLITIYYLIFITTTILVIAAPPNPEQQPTLNLLFNLDMTVGPDGDSRDLIDDNEFGVNTPLVMMPILALQHWNTRNPVILPWLSTLSSCPIMINAQICDDQCYARRAFRDLNEFSSTTHGVLGAVCSSDADSFSIGADILGGFPVLSYWASDPRLSDKATYPKFARTNPTDTIKSGATISFLLAMQYRRAVVIFINNEFGQGYVQSLLTEASSHNVTLDTVQFEQPPQTTIAPENSPEFQTQRQAMQHVKQSGLNIIVVASYAQYMPSLQRASQLEGTDTADYLYIWIGADSFSSVQSLVNVGNSSRAWSHGSLYLEIDTWGQPAFQTLTSKWATGEFASSLSYINSLLPPHGLANSNITCSNDWLNYQIPVDFFAQSANMAFDVWGYAYDSVMAYGLAACNFYANSKTIPRETDLYNALVSVNFNGASGQVRFNSNGDRDPTSLIMAMRSVTSDGNSVKFAAYEGGTWLLDLTQATWKGGYVPVDVTPPFHEHNYLPTWAKGVGYFMLAVMNCLCISFTIWLIRHRNERIVRLSQPNMLHALSFGCLIASWTVFCLTIDDNHQRWSQAGLDAACMATPALFFSGMGLACASLTAKTYRIWYLAHSPKRSRVTACRVDYFWGGVLMSQAVLWMILVAWIVSAPLVWVRIQQAQDRFGNPTNSVGVCVAGPNNNAIAFLCSMVVIFLASLMMAGMAAFSVRDLPAEVHEASYILLTLLCLLQTYMVAVPATIVVYYNVIGRFLILAMVVFLSVLFVSGFIWLPKAYTALRFDDGWFGGGGGGVPSPPHNSSSEASPPTRAAIIMQERPTQDSASPGSIVYLRNKNVIKNWSRRGKGKKALKPIESVGQSEEAAASVAVPCEIVVGGGGSSSILEIVDGGEDEEAGGSAGALVVV